MERLEQKRLARKKQTIKGRKDRFVSEYVKHKHPQLYSEVSKWHEELDQKYPTKRDLCKTLEFMRMATGVDSYNAYYHRNRYNKRKEKNSKKKNETARKNTITDNMVLEIPLLNTSESILQRASTIKDDETFLSITDQEYEDVMKELRKDPELYAMYNELNSEITDTNILDMSGVQQMELQIEHTDQSTQFLNVPNRVYEEIIHELDQDTDLRSIFNDVEYNEQSPLEEELDVFW